MRPEKAWMLSNIKSLAQSEAVIVLTDYTGLSSAAMGKLRSRLKEVSGSYLVVKDRLLRLAVKEVTGLDVKSVSLGPTGIAYGADPVRVAKVLKDFSSENERFKIKAGLLKDRLLNKNEIGELAKIPGRSVLIAQLIGLLKKPMTDLVYVLKAPIVKLVMVLAQIQDKKEKT